MQLAPYVFFYGRCEEALAFYKDALGGSYDVRKTENGAKPSTPMPGTSRFRSRPTTPPRPARIFAVLAQGGTVTMALDDVAWGGKFGMAIDRFGIEWMMSTQ